MASHSAGTGQSSSSGATTGNSSGRSGSAEKSHVVPHTRIEEESMIEEIYATGRRLGQGSFGVVRLVTHKETNTVWACKIVNKEKAGSSAVNLLEREVAILKRVRHEHIIQLREVFETGKKMYLVMEYCEGGELADVLKQRHCFSEPEVKTIIQQLASAIAYLHRNDMVHRDLKLENILLSKNPQDSSDTLYIKVTDFGLSVVKGGVGHDNMLMDFCGTPMYMAPEIIDNKSYSERCDVWAIGVIMYMLLCGSPPFQSKDEEELCEIIKNTDIHKCFEASDIWRTISEPAKDCLSGMLAKNPAYRLTGLEILHHSWITGEEKRQGNVLELMKEWRNEMTNGGEDEEATINGSDVNLTAVTSTMSLNAKDTITKKGKISPAANTRRSKSKSPTQDSTQSCRNSTHRVSTATANRSAPARNKPLPETKTVKKKTR